MHSNSGFRKVKFHAPGIPSATVIATRDFLPGEIVLEEKEPLMLVPQETLHQKSLLIYQPEYRVFLASFLAFTKLDTDKKKTFLTLPGPAIGAAEQQFVMNAKISVSSQMRKLQRAA